jgi:predicted DNA-binding protein (MmcQ/YjbR family)
MKALEQALRKKGLGYPETTEEFPWGHRTLKVRGKAFIFMGMEEGQFSLSVKLPFSREAALTLPFTEPTHYGMGKSGWVTATFPPGKEAPLPLLQAWLDESFRAVAPKRLLAQMAEAKGKRVPQRPSAKQKKRRA